MLKPLEWFLSFLFTEIYNLSGNYGISLLALSIMVNLILLPIYIPLERWKKKKTIAQAPMKMELEAIKRAYKGRERYFYTRAVHRRHNFHPTESIILSLGLLIQIPFFLAAYQMLSHNKALEGVSFWFIQNLGAADGAADFASIPINILPLIMTGLNIISAFLYTKETSERIPLWILASLFLILLYPSPAGLVLYWTANNLFSLIKQIPEIFRKNKSSIGRLWKKRVLSFFGKAYYFIPLFALYLSIVSIFYPGGENPARVILPSGVMFLLFFLELIHLGILIGRQGKGRKTRLIAAIALFAFLIYQISFGLGFIPDYIRIGLEKFSTAGIFKRRIALFSVLTGIGSLMTFPLVYPAIRLSPVVLGGGFPFQQKGRFSGWEEIFLSIAYLTGSWLLWIPLMVYSSLPNQFGFAAKELISSGFGLFLLMTILVTGVCLLIPKRWRSITWVLTTVLAFSVFLNAFLIPYDFGFLTGFNLSRNETLQGTLTTYFVDFIMITALVFLMIKGAKRWRKGIVSLLVFMNLLVIVQGLYALKTSRIQVAESPKEITQSKESGEFNSTMPLSETEENVVIFMMDMMTGGYLFEILEDNPQMKTTFDGFTWYSNTMSVGTNTVAGQPALMGGVEFAPSEVNRRKLDHSVIEEIGRSYQTMIDKAQVEGFEITMVEPFAYSYLSEAWPPLTEKKVNITAINDYIGGREKLILENEETGDENSINKQLLRAIALFRVVPFGLKAMIYDGGYWMPLSGQLVYQSYFQEQLPEWLFLKNMGSLSQGEDIPPQFYFITSHLAHHPHALSKEGVLLSDRFPDPDERDNRQGRNAYYSTEWSLKIIGEWCEALKEKGLYDNTKIIIVSDHGNYRSADYAAPIENKSSLSALGLDRVNHTAFDSILMVKDFNSHGSLRSDSRLMSTADTSYIAFTRDSKKWIDSFGSNRTVEGQLTHAWQLTEQRGPEYESFGVFQVTGDFYDLANWKRLEE